MAEVSIVTAARAGAAAEQEQAAANAVAVLNPGAREFLPWWCLGCAEKKKLSADAPEFVMAAAVVDNGGSNATPPGKVRKAKKNRPRKYMSRWQNAVNRTIFIKQIDHTVTEQMLAAIFGTYGTVMDCRICGDPSNGLMRFGFLEFQCKEEAYAALILNGSIIGLTPLQVSPSRTAICPINPMFLPQSEAEWELCARTVYCTNISKIIKSSNLKAFCEAYFGKVCRIKFMDNDKRPTNLAFVEFAEVDGAIAALDSTDVFAGGLRMRICPSKTPIRSYQSPPVLAGPLVETNQAAPPAELVLVNDNDSTINGDD